MFSDPETKKELEQTLDLCSASILKPNVDVTTPVFLPPSAEQATGEFPLGNVIYNGLPLFPFSIRHSEMFQHMAIFGRSGAGKTNLGFLMVSNLVKQKIPFMIFDWKRNFRDLLQLQGFDDVQIFTIGRETAPFRFNPLIPPDNTSPKTWLKKLIHIMAHAFFLGDGVMYLLQQTIDQVYKESGIYQGNKANPTFRDVLLKLKNYPARAREVNWLVSALRAVDSLCFGQIDEIVNSTDNFGIEDLLNRQLVFEMDALSQTDKVFFVEAIMLWIHQHRISQSRREEFVHSIIIEEAHHMLTKQRRSLAGGETIMDTMFRELREFGEGIIILDQHPSEISLTALGNTYCTVCMNLKSRADVTCMAGAMLLDSEQDSILGRMQVGQAVVKLQGRTTEPFMIATPHFKLTKGKITDDELRERMAPHLKISQPAQPKLSDKETAFLHDVVEHPNSGVAERYKRLGLSGRQGDKIKHSLLSNGHIQESESIIKTGRKKLIILTEASQNLV